MQEKGILIAIEGIDGCGKTTQVRRLKKKLTKRGFDTKVVKEPTKGTYGREIRDILRGKKEADQDELLKLFIMDRKENVNENVLPSLKEGKIVIADRYFVSTLAYQKGNKRSFEKILEAHKFAPLPELVVIIDVSPEIAINRLSKEATPRDQFENDKDFLTRVRENYLDISHVLKEKTNILVVDGEQPPNEVHRKIWAEVKRLIHK
ncbi:MAG: dTMP kinase [Candidatus Korarchaeota archaeon]|nr:dTMP kinase [Candidatus Korarchaeota archaeon]NIU83261.1 dTMP kinase [Candidatus Thorarchaeota archaeon]NIW13605.1 dTMP kinase [Candidatus Thorarchaeota archaeon]NIW51701.1 dTMP kinase [Candidatus Korarchaeota archaeon]